jgi:hypothetical protein
LTVSQHIGRERPRDLQLVDVLGVDLLELREALVGVVACRHHPVFRVLRHFLQFVVGLRVHGEHRRDAKTGRDQEMTHRESSLRRFNVRADRIDWAFLVPSGIGTALCLGKSFRQRVTAQDDASLFLSSLGSPGAFEETPALPRSWRP